MAQFYADRVAVGSHRAVTPEGYLLVKDVPIARSGVQIYRAEEIDKDGALGLNGLVEVFRPKEEVFAPAALASFEGKSVTCPHPPQFLNPDNDGHYTRGHVQNVRAGGSPLPSGEWPVLADIVIKDRTVISQVDAGHFAQLSAGYSYDLAPMEDANGKVRFKQVNIRGNHVAVVAAGRAGDDVRVLDSSPKEETTMEQQETKPGLLSDIVSFFRGMRESGFKIVDAESETVKRQEEIAKKSNSMKERTLDMKTKDADELEKEDEGAKKPVEAKDEEKEKEEKEEKKAKDARRATNDAMLRKMSEGIDALVKLATKDAKAKDKEEKEEEKEEEKDEYAEDSDLIPVATLSGEEIPKNPIPGADAAIAGLRALRPIIAASNSQEAVDTFNGVMLVLKGKVKATDSAYKSLLSRKKPDAVREAEDRSRTATDEKANADFFASARKFHRQNPNDVKVQ